MLIAEKIKHDGGTHRVEVAIDGKQAVISFGSSFTLRLDESNLVKLGDLVQKAAKELCSERRDTSDLNGRTFLVAEDEFIQHGIDAREKLKAIRMMKGTAMPGDFNPNDPVNW
jgi:hypothetical protein